jgi:hypothetical protein
MKRFYYNSIIAKILLAFSSCAAITVGPFVFIKLTAEKTPQWLRNHEACHACQWRELTAITVLLIFVLQILLVFPHWWYLLSVTAFYILYLVEWLVKLFIYKNASTAYEKVSFEVEAYENEIDYNYIESRPLLSGWIKHIIPKTAKN